MKYYLGKLNKGKYEPINCIEETDILSLINFTSNFNDESELRSELSNKNLIDGNEILAYVYKKKDDYVKIQNGNSIVYNSSKNYINANDIYKKLVEEKYNLDLYSYIASTIEARLYNVKHEIAELRTIKEVLREVNYANTIGIEKYKETKDKRDLNLLIVRFLTSFFGIWDKEKNCYKVANGRYETNKRKITDLILTLTSYYNEVEKETLYEYESKKNDNNETKNYEEIEGYDKEEFLTDEDFENYGMNPDNYRKLIRN